VALRAQRPEAGEGVVWMQGDGMAGGPKARAATLLLAVEWAAAAVFVLAVYEVVVGVAVRVWPDLGDNWVLLLWIAAAVICGFGLGKVRSGVRSLAGRLWPSLAAEPYSTLVDAITKAAATPSAEDALARLAVLVAAGTSARRVDVWVARSDGFRLAASHGDGDLRVPAEPPAGLDDLARIAGTAHVAPIAESGQVLGALTLADPQSTALRPRDLRLAADVANTAGLLMRTWNLGDRLRERIRLEAEQTAVLDVSRRRLIAARDAAREQLSKQIQTEVCVALQRCADSLQGVVDRPDDNAALIDAVTTVSGEIDEAIARFRRLVRGVYPATLTDHGLVSALENLTADLPLRATVSGPDLPRFPTRVEACAYFCLSSLLRAWPNDSGGGRIMIALHVENGDLVAALNDRPAPNAAAATADELLLRPPPHAFDQLVLESALDRVAALDGSLSVDTAGPRPAVALRIPVPRDGVAQ
jgi:signal transduction histidine kinase